MAHQSDGLKGWPKGWFGVGFSSELTVGGTLKMRYFGQELVAFRGQDGKASVLDAYCAHMGAHLGVGGKVVGNTLRCPFHSWCYDGEGRCVEIPYAKKIPATARQKAWLVQEANGVIFLHHDASGAPPEFEVPLIAGYGSAEYESAWLPWQTSQYHIKTHPREIVDNLADRGHFPTVHNTEMAEFGFEVEGLTATQRVTGKAHLPGGGVDNFKSTTTYHGPGILMMHFDGALENRMLFVHTPVDENSVDLRLALTLKIVGNREKTLGYVKAYMDNLRLGFEDDIRIWENKIYRDPPLLCDGDGPIGRLRKWYRQFYVTSSAPAESGAAALGVSTVEGTGAWSAFRASR